MSTARVSVKAKESAALRRRIRELYRCMNRHDWDGCFEHVDPKLRASGRFEPQVYTRSLQRFIEYYHKIDIWYVRVSLYLGENENKHDPRPFAYAYVLWQDVQKGLHLFRERWIRESGRWYTRVVGLVSPGKAQSA